MLKIFENIWEEFLFYESYMSAIWNLLEIKLIISIFQLLLVQVQALILWKNIFELKITRNEPGL